MTADSLRAALTAVPFVPFDLRLVDGRSFTITHSDYLGLPPGKRVRHAIVYTPVPDDPDEYRAHWIDPNLIVELTIPTESESTPKTPESSDGNHP
jgi:hypothetical protein